MRNMASSCGYFLMHSLQKSAARVENLKFVNIVRSARQKWNDEEVPENNFPKANPAFFP